MDKNPLVEPEGVNAGSADQLTDDRPAAQSSDRQHSGAQNSEARSSEEQSHDSATGDVLGGGHPEDIDPQAGPDTDLDQPDSEQDSTLLGAPTDDPREPSQVHGSAGQDAGSMD